MPWKRSRCGPKSARFPSQSPGINPPNSPSIGALVQARSGIRSLAAKAARNRAIAAFTSAPWQLTGWANAWVDLHSLRSLRCPPAGKTSHHRLPARDQANDLHRQGYPAALRFAPGLQKGCKDKQPFASLTTANSPRSQLSSDYGFASVRLGFDATQSRQPMPVASLHCSSAHQGPVVSGPDAERLHAVNEAIRILSQGKSWALVRVITSLATEGPASISDLSQRLQVIPSTIHMAVRSASIGRFTRNHDPNKPGTIHKPNLPNLLHIAHLPTHNAKQISLTATGLTLVKALLGDLPVVDTNS